MSSLSPGPAPSGEDAATQSRAAEQRSSGLAYLLLTITTLAWAGNAVASRLAVGEVSPMALTGLRWGVVMLAFVLIGLPDFIRHWRVLRERWRFCLAMGALGYTAFNALMYVAAHHTTAVNMAIMQGAMPAMVFLGTLMLYGTRASRLQVVGVGITLVGVGVVATHGEFATLRTLSFNVGDLMMLVACFSYAGYTILLRNRPAVPGLTFFFFLAFGAVLASVPLVVGEMASGTFQWPTPFGWLLVLYVGIAPSLIAQSFFMRGVELIGPNRAGLFVNLVPVFGPLLSVMILGEEFGAYHAVALALVLGGIVLAEHRTIPWPSRLRPPGSHRPN